jgi:Protein of unknown function (DUF3035)
MRAIGSKAAGLSVIALVLAAGLLSGCGLGRAFGTAKVSPDEFAIVTKAPLILPPDYSLKPPAAGTRGAATNDAEASAQQALVGTTGTQGRATSPGEQVLLSQAGANSADPLIRQGVDEEYADLIDRNDDFVNRLIFWSKPKPTAPMVDANAEAQRLAKLGKTTARAPEEGGMPPSANATESAPSGAAPDQIEGQKPPTIGKKKSSGLFGIF